MRQEKHVVGGERGSRQRNCSLEEKLFFSYVSARIEHQSSYFSRPLLWVRTKKLAMYWLSTSLLASFWRHRSPGCLSRAWLPGCRPLFVLFLSSGVLVLHYARELAGDATLALLCKLQIASEMTR